MTTAARALGLLVAIGLVACKPAAPTQPPDTPPEPEPDATATPGEPDAKDPGAPPTCADEGTPWDGKPGTCLYEHGGCCYPTPEAMCAAAGCETAHCLVMESSPAQARCADPAPTS